MQYDYDAVIVGGGPGGATAALYAERLGLKVLLLDKKHFPRDKICGDALSGKSIIYLRELGLIEALENSPQAFIDSIVFSSPNNKSVKINLVSTAYNVSKGYVCRRMVFDDILFQAAKKKVETIEGFTVTDLLKQDRQVIGVRGKSEDGTEKEFTAKVVIGADGYKSIVLKKLDLYDPDPEHMMVATRAYYRGVTGLSTAIEIHYVKSVLPGYFWIFPLENGLANVGVGMIKKELKAKNVKIRQAHINATESKEFGERFKNAELIGDISGWNLPAGSKRRQVHGDGFLLIGDAAGLVDPFTGEGIGNAMCSAKIAVNSIAEAIKAGDFSKNSLDAYRVQLWRAIGGELNLGYKLQKTARMQPLVNLVVSKASRSKRVSDWISDMIAGKVSKRELLSPLTYLRLIFN